MLQANSKEKEQTALDEINEAIKSYNAKMTKAQSKWQNPNPICTAKTLNVSMTHAEGSVKKKKRRIVVTAAVGAEKRPTNLFVKTEKK